MGFKAQKIQHEKECAQGLLILDSECIIRPQLADGCPVFFAQT
jgi:hypothetical protein